MKSEFKKLIRNDYVKGTIMLVLTTVATAIYDSIKVGIIPTDPTFYIAALRTGVSVGLLYLLKNFLTNSDDKFLKKEVNNNPPIN